MTNAPGLTGQRALVLGADGAVAAAVALALAEAGADVAVTSTTGDTEEAFSLRGLRRRIEALGRRAIADIADLGNGSSTQIAVRQIAKQFGGLDLVVAAPLLTFQKPADRITDSEWARVTSLNFDAYFYACRAAYKELAGNDGDLKGRIIALLPTVPAGDGSAALQASRAGAETLVRALAREWAKDRVFVAAVALSGNEPSPEAAVKAVVKLAGASLEQTGMVVEL